MFRITKRSRLRIFCVIELANIRVVQNIQAFGVSSHQAIFDSVVHHLHEMSCSGWSTMQVTLLRGAGVITTRSCFHGSLARCQTFEDWIEVRNDFSLAADHLAVTSLKPPNSSAGSYIHVMNAFTLKLSGASNVIDIIGITTVDNNVA